MADQQDQPLRLFFGIDVGIAVQQALQSTVEALGRELAPKIFRKVSWIQPQNTHMTLRFLGESDPQQLPALVECAERIAASAVVPPIESMGTLHGWTKFESARGTTVLVAETIGTSWITGLAGELEAAVEKMGWKPEHRRFVPHITLARIRHEDVVPVVWQELSKHHLNTPIEVHLLTLFQSVIQQGPPEYSRICDVALTMVTADDAV